MPEPLPRDFDPIRRRNGPRIESMGELRALLADSEDLEALKALAEGDPLNMLRRTQDWVAKNCYLLDLRSLAHAALTMVVAAGPTITGSEDMDSWLDGTIDIAAKGQLDQDVELARAGAPIEEPYEARFKLLMEVLHFTPDNVRTATVAANGLPPGERHVFYHCFVLGKGFGRYEEEVGIDAERARDLLLRAIDKMSDAVGD